jgi:hypothetical protein
MQTGIRIVLRARAALSHIARSGFLAEAGYADRKVVHNSGGALTVKRDQRPVGPEADNSEWLVLADDGEAEHFLIEFDGALQIRDLNADMINLGSLEIDVVLGGGGPLHSQSAARDLEPALAERATRFRSASKDWK